MNTILYGLLVAGAVLSPLSTATAQTGKSRDDATVLLPLPFESEEGPFSFGLPQKADVLWFLFYSDKDQNQVFDFSEENGTGILKLDIIRNSDTPLYQGSKILGDKKDFIISLRINDAGNWFIRLTLDPNSSWKGKLKYFNGEPTTPPTLTFPGTGQTVSPTTAVTPVKQAEKIPAPAPAVTKQTQKKAVVAPTPVPTVAKQTQAKPAATAPAPVPTVAKQTQTKPVATAPAPVPTVAKQTQTKPTATTPAPIPTVVKQTQTKPTATAPTPVPTVAKQTQTKPTATAPTPVPTVAKQTQTKPAATAPAPVPTVAKQTQTKPTVTAPTPVPTVAKQTQAKPTITAPTPVPTVAKQTQTKPTVTAPSPVPVVAKQTQSTPHVSTPAPVSMVVQRTQAKTNVIIFAPTSKSNPPAVIDVKKLKFNVTVSGFGYKKWDAQETTVTGSINSVMKIILPLINQIRKLPESSKYKILLIGHTDGVGPENPYEDKPGNIAISRFRAQAVLDYIVQNYNLPADMFEITAKGSTELKNPNDRADPANRRVLIIFQP